MRAQSLHELLEKGDRVAVSNITGREASKVSVVSQSYCDNIVAGWALGKNGAKISVPNKPSIPVFGQFDDLMDSLPDDKKPNKIVVYSPPEAVYGDVKEVIDHGKTGWLCGADAESLRHAIRHLLGHPDLCRQMGARARAFAEENFSLDQIVEKERALLDDVVNGGAPNA